MISFESDYIAGAHGRVLEALCRTNLEALSGYGSDIYSERACERIRAACELPEAQVRLLCGGTQTNSVVISTMLHDSEGVVAAHSGHISTHEAGAIEYSGHKVLTVQGTDGKILPVTLEEYLRAFYTDVNREHAVFPGMVYISHPTEYGTLYTKTELAGLSRICREHGIPLYLDGARLAYALAAEGTDLTLPDIAKLCDVFYIGGTKCGALCGEAVVFTRGNMPKHFLTSVKKRGALLAKGRLTGVQFDALFEDGLYFEIGKHAIEKANRLKGIFAGKGYEFFTDSPTNQVFIVLENEKLKTLEREVAFSFWEKAGDARTVVRFATSWSTTDEDIDALERLL